MNKFFQLFVYDKKNPKVYYRNLIIFGAVFAFIYIFFTIGDLVIKGYSDLSFTPIGLMAVVIGVLIGLYLKAKS